jgi:hypothetical protein
MMGVAQDVQEGFVFEERCLQFIVVTHFNDAAPGDPDRDFHTVRVLGDEMCKVLASTLKGAAGRRVMVSGRLRLVPQYEPAAGKYYHFPMILVQGGAGAVHVL